MENDQSLVNEQDAEWRKRPVNVMKVFKSLYHQLTKGADLTRISMPSEIYHPFSVLEVIAHRELSSISTLYQLNNYPDDSLQRFLCVTKWVVSFLSREKIEKKPYNPTIGEEHICWVEHSENDRTELFLEQVSHHPPLTALFLQNENQKISLVSSLETAVSFSGNSVTIVTSGDVTIDTAFEEYHISKHVPNLIIRRVIFGEKYFVWSGPITLECPDSGYKLNLHYSEKNENTNRARGQITKDGKVIFEIKGSAGKEIYYWKPEEGDKKKKEFYRFISDISPLEVAYPPTESRVPSNSLRQWKEVSDAIVKNDMIAADLAKNKIEQLQRVREKKREQEGEEYHATYFDQKMVNEKIVWEARPNIKINSEHLEELKGRATKEREEEKRRTQVEEEEKNLATAQQKEKKEDINNLKKSDSQLIKKKSHSSELISLRKESSAKKEEGDNDENCIIS
jgi:hypothetical protein